MSAFSRRFGPPGEDIVGVEIPCLHGDAVWTAPAEELFRMCSDSLAADGILEPGEVERLLLVRSPHAYPIYRTGWSTRLRRVTEHLDARGDVTPLGRSGEFRYMDIDRCLRRAFDVVEDLLEDRGR
jgi:protoporphyrinogen oxidase